VVLVALGGVDLELGGEVAARVLLLVHGEGRHLRVAQIRLVVGLVDAARERFAVVAAGEDALPLLADHDRRSGILARGQHHLRRDLGVPEHLERHESVVIRGLGVVEDPAQLRQVAWPEQMRHVAVGLSREQGERLGLYLEQRLALELRGRDVLAAELAIGGLVFAVDEAVLEFEVCHGQNLANSRGTASGKGL
jgi:hypothetical protein